MRLGVEARHCGELVKGVASLKGVSPGDLTRQDHMELDARTAKLASQPELMVIEGCFLNYVLANVDCMLLELTCDPLERKRRFELRGSSQSYSAQEVSDEDLIRSLYAGQQPKPPTLSIETTHTEADAVTEEVVQWLEGSRLG